MGKKFTDDKWKFVREEVILLEWKESNKLREKVIQYSEIEVWQIEYLEFWLLNE